MFYGSSGGSGKESVHWPWTRRFFSVFHQDSLPSLLPSSFQKFYGKTNSPFHIYSLVLPGPSPPEPLTKFCHEMKLLVKVAFSRRMCEWTWNWMKTQGIMNFLKFLYSFIINSSICTCTGLVLSSRQFLVWKSLQIKLGSSDSIDN